MKIITSYIKKNPEIATTLIGLIVFLIIGIIDDNLGSMLIVFAGVIVFGVIIGIISALLKIFIK